ncbi:DUF1015 family protein [Burkholderia glumae]|uniref:DUF1015 family protein n=1 Tax=Burkholderia glumae TaxID=337 RepID=UPI0018E2497C|nr:DUF1015 family protein [Burkholderia glumae]MCM2494902.1 DUF1015 family protein [Burkholderia glumae]MCM2545767.1 DUF1015 family protein [Burkholderia glumae]
MDHSSMHRLADNWIRPLSRAWIANGPVAGPNADEVADAQVADLLTRLDSSTPSLLAIQHPHRTPHARAMGWGIEEALGPATDMLASLERSAYRELADVVLLYHIHGIDGEVWGALCMVDTAAARPDGAPLVRDTEAVYPESVRVRTAVMSGLARATSAVLLTPVFDGDALTATIRAAAADLGAPLSVTADQCGRRHRLWALAAGAARDTVVAAASAHPLLVADGNHRVAAASAGRLDGLLAMVTAGPDLRVGAFHRVLSGTGLDGRALESAWLGRGMTARRTAPVAPDRPGQVVAVTANGAWKIELPKAAAHDPTPVDHHRAEQLLFSQLLGIDPAGTAVRALPASSYRGALPSGADAVLLFAPARFDDVLALHRAGERMPRKSTYFTPKPLSGLVLAELRRASAPHPTGKHHDL